MDKNILRTSEFVPLIDIAFWTKFTNKKINEIKLDEAPFEISANYKINNYQDKNSILIFDNFSFVQ